MICWSAMTRGLSRDSVHSFPQSGSNGAYHFNLCDDLHPGTSHLLIGPEGLLCHAVELH